MDIMHHQQQEKLGGYSERAPRWICFRFVINWCKRKRRTILICAGAVLLVAAGGLVAFHRFRAAPALCSFPSIISSPSSNLSEETTIMLARVANESNTAVASTSAQRGNKPLITDEDRLMLEYCLETEEKGGWSPVVNIARPVLEYRLLERHPTGGGPMQYLSITHYKFIDDTTQIRNFMTDNEYKLQNDKMFKSFTTLDLDLNTGIEVWHAVKDYPLIGPRQYVLATKLWEREHDKSYFCVTKACNHPKAPKLKYPLITHSLSGWRISKATKGGCEVKMFYQEDIQSKLAAFKTKFKNQIVEYVLKSEKSLVEYILQKHQPKEGRNAVTLAQKII